jgi:predicted RND superfamily exporter protein
MNIFASKMAVDKDANHGFWFDISGNLKVVVVSGSSTEKYSQAFKEADSYYNALVNFFKARGGTIGDVPAGSGLQNAFASTEIDFYAMQSAITQGAYDSAMYSTIFALLVLVLLTRRFVSSILVAFHLACVVVCVLGVFVQLGWVLGVVESVIAALAVGLACDFAAHLAHSFNDEQPHPQEDETPLTFPRSIDELFQQLELSKEKSTGAITNLGVTITMGFLSTFFAGCCLLVTDLYFTQQFGIFMCCVMAFSFSFAFLYLMPTLATIGWTDRLLAKWTDDNVLQPVYSLVQKQEQSNVKVAIDGKEDNQVAGSTADLEMTVTVQGEVL